MAEDRRGTLTKGKPQVTDVQPFGSATEVEILTAAGAVEAHSSHPLAVSFMAHAKKNGISITSASDGEAIAGKGVRGKVDGREIIVGATGRLDLHEAVVVDRRFWKATAKVFRWSSPTGSRLASLLFALRYDAVAYGHREHRQHQYGHCAGRYTRRGAIDHDFAIPGVGASVDATPP